MSFYNNLQKIILLCKDALQRLGKQIDEQRLESLSIFVAVAMSHPKRVFHTCGHIQDVAKRQEPLGILASMYHDVIYYHVDKEFPPLCPKDTINSVKIISPYEMIVSDYVIKQDNYKLVADVFGFKTGHTLTSMTGMNEFLSAITAVSHLQNILSRKELLTIVSSIELTIPFRGGPNQKSYGFNLECRLNKIEKNLPDINKKDIEIIIKTAINVANQDVYNFRDPKVEEFINNTWKVLLENHQYLRSEYYTTKQYRTAIQSMSNFFNTIHPSQIFINYLNVPDIKTYKSMIKQTQSNLIIAKKYLTTILYTASILEAITQLTGQDIPLSYLLGDLALSNANKSKNSHILWSQFLPHHSCDHTVSKLLEETKWFNNDHIPWEPLSALTYRLLGDEIAKNIIFSEDYFDNKMSAHTFINSQPKLLIKEIICALTKSTTTRYLSLLKLI